LIDGDEAFLASRQRSLNALSRLQFGFPWYELVVFRFVLAAWLHERRILS